MDSGLIVHILDSNPNQTIMFSDWTGTQLDNGVKPRQSSWTQTIHRSIYTYPRQRRLFCHCKSRDIEYQIMSMLLA